MKDTEVKLSQYADVTRLYMYIIEDKHSLNSVINVLGWLKKSLVGD